jgi:hypothetical protein
MSTTNKWAESLKINTAKVLPPVRGYSKPYARSASEVATRAIISQGVVAVAYGVAAAPIVKWFRAQRLWRSVTSQEQDLLLAAELPEANRPQFQWKQEAEWTLLWMIGKVESLGLPTRCCDTRRLVDEIIPPLGESVRQFIAGARLRSPGALLAEDERTYDLWCRALAAQRRGEPLPTDLNLRVLRERRYAFEWMDGNQDWDEVTCDA